MYPSPARICLQPIVLVSNKKNYPVHEKELLAVIRTLKKWRTDLLGIPFLMYTDHRTLENFDTQRDLSQRQLRWQEYMSRSLDGLWRGWARSVAFSPRGFLTHLQHWLMWMWNFSFLTIFLFQTLWGCKSALTLLLFPADNHAHMPQHRHLLWHIY
jgi:hypothetical protein